MRAYHLSLVFHILRNVSFLLERSLSKKRGHAKLSATSRRGRCCITHPSTGYAGVRFPAQASKQSVHSSLFFLGNGRIGCILRRRLWRHIHHARRPSGTRLIVGPHRSYTCRDNTCARTCVLSPRRGGRCAQTVWPRVRLRCALGRRGLAAVPVCEGGVGHVDRLGRRLRAHCGRQKRRLRVEARSSRGGGPAAINA